MAMTNGNLPIKEGYFVQWRKDGEDQWHDPQMILAFSPDGKLAFFERGTEGIPVSELSVVGPPKAPLA
ncbi:MAG: hypothetical protein ACLQNE_25645 [Thermoguttaceae bacterium]